jgi:hypothetical protein
MSTHGHPSGSGPDNMSRHTLRALAVDTALQPQNAVQTHRVPPPAILVELVERFQVSWETVPEFAFRGTQKRRIGFALELCGHLGSDAEHPAETCIHCHNVFGSLHAIADWALPRERRAMMEGPEVHFPCVTYSRARPRPVGVRFVIRVVHRGGTEEVDDERIAQWLGDLEWRLRDLGAVEQIASIGRSEL